MSTISCFQMMSILAAILNGSSSELEIHEKGFRSDSILWIFQNQIHCSTMEWKFWFTQRERLKRRMLVGIEEEPQFATTLMESNEKTSNFTNLITHWLSLMNLSSIMTSYTLLTATLTHTLNFATTSSQLSETLRRVNFVLYALSVRL